MSDSADTKPMPIQSDSLWGKWGSGSRPTLPLLGHLLDTAAFAQVLWEVWLPPATKTLFSQVLPNSVNEESVGSFYSWLAAVHDLGKAEPIFQGQLLSRDRNIFAQHFSELLATGVETLSDEKLKQIQDSISSQSGGEGAITRRLLRHEAHSGESLHSLGFGWPATVLSGHHGQYLPKARLAGSLAQGYRSWVNESSWGVWQRDAARTLAEILGVDIEKEIELSPQSLNSATIPFLTGFVCLADWLASDERFVEHANETLLTTNPKEYFQARCQQALQRVVDDLGTPQSPSGDFPTLFDGKTPTRPVQEWAVNETPPAEAKSSLTILTVPMGEGKTETVLYQHSAGFETYQDGLFIALPTTATADAMWGRVETFFNETSAIGYLAHGRAILNAQYAESSVKPVGICAQHDRGLSAGTWFRGPHRALSAPVTVGTVDQVLATAVSHKYIPMRLMSLSTKHLVVDEVHSLDPYQHALLERLLGWLGYAGGRVTLLTATLPTKRLKQYVAAFESGRRFRENQPLLAAKNVNVTGAYPSVTTTDNNGTKIVSVESYRAYSHQINPLSVPAGKGKQAIVDTATSLRREHPQARIGIIMNVVDRSIEVAREISSKSTGERVQILHSRMLAGERSSITESLLAELGPNSQSQKPITVVSTQILESSVDVDFDFLITELAPMASLLQRMGRQWRHSTPTRTETGFTWFHQAHKNQLREPLKQPEVTIVAQVTETGEVSGGRASLPYSHAELTKTWNALGNPNSPIEIAIPEDLQALVDEADVCLDDLSVTDSDGLLASLQYHLTNVAAQNRSAKEAGIEVTRMETLRPDSWDENSLLAMLTSGRIWNEDAVTRLRDNITATLLVYDVSGSDPRAWHGDPASLTTKPVSRENLRDIVGFSIPISGKHAKCLAPLATRDKDNPVGWAEDAPPILRDLVCVSVKKLADSGYVVDNFGLHPTEGL